MGRILEYVVLISNLSLILGGLPYKDHGSNYEGEKHANFSRTVKFYPKGQNEYFSKRILPLEYNPRRRLLSSNPKQMRKMIGLHAFSAEEIDRKGYKRNFSDSNFRNVPRRNPQVTYTHGTFQRQNSKNVEHGEVPSQKISRAYNTIQHQHQHQHQHQNQYQSRRPGDVNKVFHKDGRNARYSQKQWHSPKICDPCNSVPWVPILNVPDSYRQQRTHLNDLHSQQHNNLDFHGYASDTHNVLVPPTPLVPPLEPIYDGTISSSFGLPIGNIPTGHGMLAPLNHIASIDYSNSFNFYSPHGLLESQGFPQLSPVPVVPIHDSGQFYQYDTSIPDLVPPPAKNVDVSKVVLTISEDSSGKSEPSKSGAYHNHKQGTDSSSSSTTANSQGSHSSSTEKYQDKVSGKLEIVKSIPLAEFTSGVNGQQQQLPLYPPLQSEGSNDKEYNTQKSGSHSNSNYNFLVPPLKTEANFGGNKSASSYSKEGQTGELQGEPSAPKPLTSPSLSWLFSDHTAPPDDSKSTASVLSFATETEEIASVVNNGLRPVSPRPIPIALAQNGGNPKSKKIQIIIPYTTKNKNEHDNNALESVQHEVFQPPVSKSTSENNSLRDFATPAIPPLTHESDTTGDGKVIDGVENPFKDEIKDEDEIKSGKFLSEMHHIIASNLRELLREEIEKSQNDQNYPLQNNIDNWTALEYSNHKTVEPKAPKEIISQALAVTSIPGTSISHLLLPSKKIPNEYFKTTPIPIYDEPTSSVYKTTNSTVNSSPFTAKPYATTTVYNPTRSFRETSENTPPIVQFNHERNYTDVARGRVNNWGRLTENMVVPEARTRTRRIDENTTPSWSSNRYVSSGSEKIQIVTPISLTAQRNYTATFGRRTTRDIHNSETPTTEIPRRIVLSSRINSTKLERVSKEIFPFFRRFTLNSTTTQNVSSSTSAINTTTETTPTTTTTTTTTSTTDSTVTVNESVVETNVTGTPNSQPGDSVRFTSKSEHLSINDVFPFRNKELPWQSNLNASQTSSRIGRQRKSLIKQVNLQRPKPVVSSS